MKLTAAGEGEMTLINIDILLRLLIDEREEIGAQILQLSNIK